MRKIAWVTGSEGFIGSYVSQMMAQNFTVHCIDRRLGKEITVETMQALPMPAVVVHCAGNSSVKFSMDKPEVDHRDSVEATKTLVDYLTQYAAGAHIIYLSSCAVYGVAGNYREDALPCAVSHYAQNKIECEARLLTSWVKTTVIRPSSVYGPGQLKQMPYDLAKMLVSNGPVQLMGCGDETRDFVYVQDLVTAIVEIASGKRAPRIMNFGTGVQTSVHDFAEMMSRAMNISTDIFFTGEVRSYDPMHSGVDTEAMRFHGFKTPTQLWSGLNKYANWVRMALRKVG